MRSSQGLVLLVGLMFGCNNATVKHPQKTSNVIRYRLLLRNNPVSSRDASRCFAECQPAPTPKQYIQCLQLCTGFEETPGEVCSNTDKPPEAACFNVRKVPAKTEPSPGMVVLAVVGEVALVVGAASLCSVSSSQCGWPLPPLPPPK
jgi:hypothetical protein